MLPVKKFISACYNVSIIVQLFIKFYFCIHTVKFLTAKINECTKIKIFAGMYLESFSFTAPITGYEKVKKAHFRFLS
jgi:hypothetical protein